MWKEGKFVVLATTHCGPLRPGNLHILCAELIRGRLDASGPNMLALPPFLGRGLIEYYKDSSTYVQDVKTACLSWRYRYQQNKQESQNPKVKSLTNSIPRFDSGDIRAS